MAWALICPSHFCFYADSLFIVIDHILTRYWISQNSFIFYIKQKRLNKKQTNLKNVNDNDLHNGFMILFS